jgi:hypothetical protein
VEAGGNRAEEAKVRVTGGPEGGVGVVLFGFFEGPDPFIHGKAEKAIGG